MTGSFMVLNRSMFRFRLVLVIVLASTALLAFSSTAVAGTYDGTSGTVDCDTGTYTVLNNVVTDGYGCWGTATIPNTVTEIGFKAFEGGNSISRIAFQPNSQLTTIAEKAFYANTTLTAITFPKSVTTLGSLVLRFSSVETLAFEPQSKLTTIGTTAFYGSESLRTVTIPNSVTTIGAGAFNLTPRLTRISFEPNSQLASIGDYAFTRATSLTSFTVPGTVTAIGSQAFDGNTVMAGVYFLGSTAPTIGTNAFNNVAAGATAYRNPTATGFNATGDPPMWNGLRVANLPTNTLTVTTAGSGGGTTTSDAPGINCGPVCTASFFSNQIITLTANPSPGSVFSGWTGEACGGTGTCVVSMSDPRSVTATYTANSPVGPPRPSGISWTKTGSSDKPLIASFIANAGTTYTITATSNATRQRQTRTNRTARGACKITTNKKTKKRIATCTIRLKKPGTWLVAITPTANGVAGTPATKTITIRATTKKTRTLLSHHV